MRKMNLLLVVAALFLFALWDAAKSEAVPVFARKYKTSCQTCHTAFPRLNPFGEAFRMNGHQWPGTVDDEQEHSKDDAVKLGAEAYKKVFPDAVWPSTLPGSPPISMLAEGGLTYEKSGGTSTTTFEQPTLELQASGNFGENLTFFIAGPIFEDGSIQNADLDHFFLEFDNLFHNRIPNHLLYLRVGKFSPEMTFYQSAHDEFTLTPVSLGMYSPEDGASLAGEGGASTGSTLAAGSLRFLEPRMGLQVNGLVNGRFRYVLGLQNDGSPDASSGARNTYGRLVYKWGGMGYDGSNPAQTDHPYQETSLAVAAYAYRGLTPNDAGQGPDNLVSTRVGGELNGVLNNLVLFGGFMHGRDETVLNTGETGHRAFDAWYVQEEYVIYPWLMGVFRYEQAKADGFDTVRRIVPNITTLYRANVALRLEAPMDPDNLKLDTVMASVIFAY